eukprot:TRINITY_DN844_c0_g1_i5.p1 TRINITY_DN844_c0_g1~~TRINITY_DN844_c0_g1_i5.p1  ORF type:complete len:494 (-),score=82.12 TRINITY_DN844_c0_g1_i5:185-1666(-)
MFSMMPGINSGHNTDNDTISTIKIETPLTPPNTGSSPSSPPSSPSRQVIQDFAINPFLNMHPQNPGRDIRHMEYMQSKVPIPKIPIQRRGVKRQRPTESMRSINALNTIQKTRELSEEEQQALKRQERLIKNRESAQKSRQRRKQYITDLETKVSALSTELESVKKERNRYRSHVAELQNTVDYLNDVIENAPGVPQVVLHRMYEQRAAKTRSIASTAKAAGVACLMIFLFSFGLFFSSASNTSPINVWVPIFPRAEIPTVVPNYDGNMHPSKILKAFIATSPDDAEDLLLQDVEGAASSKIKIQQRKEEVLSSSPFLSQLMQQPNSVPFEKLVAKKERKPVLHKLNLMTSQNGSLAVPLKEEEDDELDSTLDLDLNDVNSKSLVAVDKYSSLPTSPAGDSLVHEPDRTYIFCPSAREILSLGEIDVSRHKLMSLLIPLDGNNSFSGSTESTAVPESILELSCLIQDVNIYTTAPKQSTNPKAETEPFSVVVR